MSSKNKITRRKAVWTQLRASVAIFKLSLKTFLYQPIGIIMTFILPIILLVILTYMFYGISSHENPSFQISTTLRGLLPGLVVMPTITIGMLGVPFTFTLFKESGILKKIGITPTKSYTFLISFIFTFAIMELFSSIATFALAKIIWQSDAPNPYNASIMVPWLMSSMVGIAMGLFIGGISKDSATGFGIGVGLFMPAVFLSGCMFPSLHGWIAYFGKIAPHNESITIFKLAWNYGTLVVKDYPPYFDNIVLISELSDTLYSYLYPLLFFAATIVVNKTTFKWQ
ncbi:MAG: ABC transporter permease [Mycoplasma sp.]|nr:ABC transporter permease [Mycoplasma sp.]